jgi:hypothetical protein
MAQPFAVANAHWRIAAGIVMPASLALIAVIKRVLFNNILR